MFRRRLSLAEVDLEDRILDLSVPFLGENNCYESIHREPVDCACGLHCCSRNGHAIREARSTEDYPGGRVDGSCSRQTFFCPPQWWHWYTHTHRIALTPFWFLPACAPGIPSLSGSDAVFSFWSLLFFLAMSGQPVSFDASHPPHGHPDNVAQSTQQSDKPSTASHPPPTKPDSTLQDASKGRFAASTTSSATGKPYSSLPFNRVAKINLV